MFGNVKMQDVKDALESVLRKVLDIGDGSVKKIQELKSEISQLREEKAELEFRKKMEEKEITHLVKMKEEKIAIETERKELELAKDYQAKEMKLQTEYFEKVMSTVKDGHAKMENIYTEIMKRLPNVNMSIENRHNTERAG